MNESKKLKDGTKIPDRAWYYILDFNDRDQWRTIKELSDITQLTNLTKEQFIDLFRIATEKDKTSILLQEFNP